MLYIDLQMFANHVNVTTDVRTDGQYYPTYNDLSAEMKTYYDLTLLDEAGPNLVHDQFGQKRPIPAGGGKTIEFRKTTALPLALTPLTEGVTPDGQRYDVTSLTATVAQYGDFVTLSDVLELTAIDNMVVEVTKSIGRQAGVTLDTVVRNVLVAGTNVSYCSKWSGATETPVAGRSAMDKTCKLTVDSVMQAVAKLRAQNAPTFDGDYVAIIHPYVAYDLMRDPEWTDAYKYTTPENIFKGEIGRIAGVRFVQSTQAKIVKGTPLTAGSATLTVKTNTSSSTSVPVKEKITSDDHDAFAARESDDKKVWIGGTEYTVSALNAGNAGSASITLSASASLAADAVITSEGGAGDGGAVFCNLFFGRDAYGVTEIEGGGLETIVKQKGSAGTADALNQRSSVGWKAIRTAEILNNAYMVRVESCSPRFSANAAEN